MRQARTFWNQPICSLQWMLRTIAQYEGDMDVLVPSGIYEPLTQIAVSKFQRSHGLPVTGVTDYNTWNKVVQAYDEAIVMISPAQSIDPEYQAVFPPAEGQYSPYLHLAQCMLFFLANFYHGVFQPETTGYMNETTRQSFSDFQRLCALPVTGRMDKRTWKYLALHFAAATAWDETGKGNSSAKKVYKKLDK